MTIPDKIRRHAGEDRQLLVECTSRMSWSGSERLQNELMNDLPRSHSLYVHTTGTYSHSRVYSLSAVEWEEADRCLARRVPLDVRQCRHACRHLPAAHDMSALSCFFDGCECLLTSNF